MFELSQRLAYATVLSVSISLLFKYSTCLVKSNGYLLTVVFITINLVNYTPSISLRLLNWTGGEAFRMV